MYADNVRHIIAVEDRCCIRLKSSRNLLTTTLKLSRLVLIALTIVYEEGAAIQRAIYILLFPSKVPVRIETV